MSYALRGNNCNCSTPALTSNAKYIAPLSAVYYDQITDMWLYPGRTGFTYPYQHPFGPDTLKAWRLESDNYGPGPGRRIVYQNKQGITPDLRDRERHRSSLPIQQKRKSCPTCSTHN